MKTIKEIMSCNWSCNNPTCVQCAISNKRVLIGKHKQPEGFYPTKYFYFVPERILGSGIVRGRTIWLDGSIYENTFWVIPGHEEWLLARESEIETMRVLIELKKLRKQLGL